MIKKETMKGMFLLDKKRDHEGSVAAVELCLFFCILSNKEVHGEGFFLRQYVTAVLSADGAEALPPKWERNRKEPPARVRTRKRRKAHWRRRPMQGSVKRSWAARKYQHLRCSSGYVNSG